MAVPGAPAPETSDRARKKLENDYKASVVYFLGGLAILAGWAILLVLGVLRGPAAGLLALLLGLGILIAIVGGSLTAVNGWLLKQRWPNSPLPSMR